MQAVTKAIAVAIAIWSIKIRRDPNGRNFAVKMAKTDWWIKIIIKSMKQAMNKTHFFNSSQNHPWQKPNLSTYFRSPTNNNNSINSYYQQATRILVERAWEIACQIKSLRFQGPQMSTQFPRQKRLIADYRTCKRIGSRVVNRIKKGQKGALIWNMGASQWKLRQSRERLTKLRYTKRLRQFSRAIAAAL